MPCKEWNLGETQFAYILIFIILFYFILTWRSNYLILFLTLFIDFMILFIFLSYHIRRDDACGFYTGHGAYG